MDLLVRERVFFIYVYSVNASKDEEDGVDGNERRRRRTIGKMEE